MMLHFTICSVNYLHFATTLANSLKDVDPLARFVVFLADEVVHADKLAKCDFEIIPIQKIRIPNLLNMAMKYDILEFNTAVKPFCFEYIFDELQQSEVVYLDPDIFVIRPLDDVERLLSNGASCVLTPHISEPLRDSKHPSDLSFLQVGVFNLGFIAFSSSDEARCFIRWWAERLVNGCLVDLTNGIFVDQKYVDLAPAFLANLSILRHPGYNLAYWNLLNREISGKGLNIFANDLPVHFVHFSGGSVKNDGVFSKHQNRFMLSDLPKPLRELHDFYYSAVRANDQRDCNFSNEPYAFNFLSNGTPINRFMRAVYRRYEASVGKSPFGLEDEYFNDTSDQLPIFGKIKISRMYFEVWKARSDLQVAFDLFTYAGQRGFLSWASQALFTEYGIAEKFITPLPDNDHVEADSLRTVPSKTILDKALTSRGFIARNFFRRLMMGKSRTRDYWDRRLAAGRVTNAVGIANSGTPLRAGVDLYGLLQSESGTGQLSRGFASALKVSGLQYSTRSLSSHGSFEDNETFSIINENVDHDTALICLNADLTTRLRDFIPPVSLAGKRKIGHWVWELPVFPAAWAEAFKNVDEIWAPSRFVGMCIKSATEIDVKIVPYVVERTKRDKQAARQRFELPRDELLILVAFDFNSFAARKNPLAALNAFIDAFPYDGASAPHLVVKCHGAPSNQIRRSIIDRLANHSRVHILDKVLRDDEMNELQNAIDIYISTHRSEGFGLNIAECMLLEKLVLATGFSGNEDFMSSQNSIAIPYTLKSVGRDEYPFWFGQHWAHPDHHATVDLLRHAVRNFESLESLRMRGSADIKAGYSPDRVGSVLRNALEGISLISLE